jgi:hypothetical protein
MADKDTLLDGVEGLLRRSVPWFKSQLDSLVSAGKGLLRGLVSISRKKKGCSHRERCTRAKAKDRFLRWRRQALPVALVVRCRHRSSKKAQRLAADISEPVHWKWKKKKVGLSSIVKTKFASTPSCAIPKCQSCELAQARQRSSKVKKVQLNFDSEGAISCAILKCQSCELAWDRQRSPKVKKVQLNLDSEGAISCVIPKCSWLGLDRDLPKLRKFS